MKVPRSELVPILARLSANLPAKKFADEVAGYLLASNRTGELDSLARDMVGYRSQEGVIEVTAVSARRLTGAALDEVRQKIKQLYPGAKRVIINQRIDSDQIGGVRLEMPGQQLDLSVRGKLNQFKQLTSGS